MQQLTTYYSNRLSVPLTPVLPVKMWYKAEQGVTYNTTGELTQWQDSSGNGFHMFPDGGSAALSPDLMNGHRMVRVIGKLSTPNLCGIVGNRPRTVYFLGRLVTGNVIVSCGTSEYGFLFECMQLNTYPLLHAWGTGMSNFGKLPPQPIDKPAMWAWRYNGRGGFCDFNADRGSEGILINPLNTADTPFFLAWGSWYSRTIVSTVDFLEVLVYDRFLNQQEDQQVRSYLGTKGNVPITKGDVSNSAVPMYRPEKS